MLLGATLGLGAMLGMRPSPRPMLGPCDMRALGLRAMKAAVPRSARGRAPCTPPTAAAAASLPRACPAPHPPQAVWCQGRNPRPPSAPPTQVPLCSSPWGQAARSSEVQLCSSPGGWPGPPSAPTPPAPAPAPRPPGAPRASRPAGEGQRRRGRGRRPPPPGRGPRPRGRGPRRGGGRARAPAAVLVRRGRRRTPGGSGGRRSLPRRRRRSAARSAAPVPTTSGRRPGRAGGAGLPRHSTRPADDATPPLSGTATRRALPQPPPGPASARPPKAFFSPQAPQVPARGRQMSLRLAVRVCDRLRWCQMLRTARATSGR